MRTRLCLIFFIYANLTFSQGPGPHYQFIEHLQSSNKNQDAVALLHFEKNRFHPDTLNFLLGYNQHFLRRHDSAVFYLKQVNEGSALFVRAGAFEVLNHFYSKNYGLGIDRSRQVLVSKDEDRQLFHMMSGAGSLLQRDYHTFDSLSAQFRFDNHAYTIEQQNLIELRKDLQNQKRKSPVVAGLLSAAVPGLGKYYAGKKGAALAAFATNVVLAGFAVESYYRNGPKSPQFITFGTIFAFFYTGNIFGSVYSVKQQIRSTNGKLNNEILATIHISIDRMYSM